MRLFDSQIPAMIAGAGIWLLLPCGARADDRSSWMAIGYRKPTPPFRPLAIRFTARHSMTSASATLEPDSRDGEGSFSGHHKKLKAQKFVDQGVARFIRS